MSTPLPLPAFNDLHRIFQYRDDGVLVRKSNGKQAGRKSQSTYSQVGINKKQYLVHRIIFLMRHGHCPDMIDHINGKKHDNRIENLRPITPSRNALKQKLRRASESLCTGVHRSGSGWEASIMVRKKYRYLGRFADINDAIAARVNAEIKYVGNVMHKPTTQTHEGDMKYQSHHLRVDRALHGRLKHASQHFGVTINCIFHRMLTKHQRIKSEHIASNVVTFPKTETATRGTVLTLRLPPHLLDGVEAAQLRGMVSDYLDHENNKPKRPAFETDKVAGRDYLEG